MVRQAEGKLVDMILGELKSHHYIDKSGWWFKVHGGPMQQRGIPDIIGVYKGRFCAFEVKMPGKEGETSRMQDAILKRIQMAGGIAMVITEAYDALLELRKIDRLT
jgi:hypothetical protein